MKITLLGIGLMDTRRPATDLGDVWGIGQRIDTQLREAGLKTALDVARMNPAMVRRRWSVVLERTVRELQGQDCIILEGPASAEKGNCVHPQFWQAGHRSG